MIRFYYFLFHEKTRVGRRVLESERHLPAEKTVAGQHQEATRALIGHFFSLLPTSRRTAACR